MLTTTLTPTALLTPTTLTTPPTSTTPPTTTTTPTPTTSPTTTTMTTTLTPTTTPTPTTSLTPTTTPAGPCPPSWIWRPGTDNCFKSTGYWFDWNSAESLCKVWVSHLTSIHTESEQRFIESLLKVKPLYEVYICIGLIKYEGYFVWSDGPPLTYTYWYQGELLIGSTALKFGTETVGNGMLKTSNFSTQGLYEKSF